MSDLFKEKAQEWDSRPISLLISEQIGKALLEQVSMGAEMSVMDFGAGTGLLCTQVAPKVKRVVAVDISDAMLQKLAQKTEQTDNVVSVCQDILSQPLNERFDLIISAMALHHVQDTDALLKRLFEHLAPNGSVALADLDHEDGHFHPLDVEGVYHHGFERAVLQQQLEQAGFHDIHFTTAAKINKEGRKYPVFLGHCKKGLMPHFQDEPEH